MESVSLKSHPRSLVKQTSIVTHAGFVLSGVVTVLLGALLPVLKQTWALDDAQVGWLFVAQSAGYLIAAAVSNSFIKRRGVLRVLAAGYGLMAIGVASLIAGKLA